MTEIICAHGRDHGYSCCPEHGTHKMRMLGGHTQGCPDRDTYGYTLQDGAQGIVGDLVEPTDEQIEMGVRQLGVCTCERHGPYGSPCPRDGTTKDKARAVLTPVLTDAVARIKAHQSPPYTNKHLVSAYREGLLAAVAILQGEKP